MLVSGDFLLVLVYGSRYAGHGTGDRRFGGERNGPQHGPDRRHWALGHRSPKANLPADLATLVATLTVVCCLVQPLGVLGAALADLAGNVIGALVRLAVLRRLLKTTPLSPEAS